jgi:hypothetical protein
VLSQLYNGEEDRILMKDDSLGLTATLECTV